MKRKMNEISTIPLIMLLDLNEEEAKTLCEIIKNSPLSLSELARIRNLSRTTLYKHIEALHHKGLITTPPSSHKIIPTDKSEIERRIDHALEESQAKLEETMRGALEETPSIAIRTDGDAVSDVYEDIAISLPRGGTYFRYTSRKEDGKRNQKYTELKKKKDIERLVITSVEKANTKTVDPNRFIKTIPGNFTFDDDISFIIYDNKVVHVDHKTGATVTITSKNIARFQEKIFKILWRKL